MANVNSITTETLDLAGLKLDQVAGILNAITSDVDESMPREALTHCLGACMHLLGEARAALGQ